jgi:3-methyladenine DNA glycosylase AlkD
MNRLQAELRALASAKTAAGSQRYFKTGPGEYGAGDQFLGVTVPSMRALAKQHRDATLAEIETLLHSEWHEERLLSLLLLMAFYQRGDDVQQEAAYQLYLANTATINNWDLVDVSAPHIIGRHLFTRPRDLLDQFGGSTVLWERRIAIIATFYFIRQQDYVDSLRLAARLLNDPHDLMHKAVGWMLREIGKRDLATEEQFLQQHYRQMPRTMLRYAIERFPEDRRQAYLRGSV